MFAPGPKKKQAAASPQPERAPEPSIPYLTKAEAATPRQKAPSPILQPSTPVEVEILRKPKGKHQESEKTLPRMYELLLAEDSVLKKRTPKETKTKATLKKSKAGKDVSRDSHATGTVPRSTHDELLSSNLDLLKQHKSLKEDMKKMTSGKDREIKEL